jgi:hypothetical protein
MRKHPTPRIHTIVPMASILPVPAFVRVYVFGLAQAHHQGLTQLFYVEGPGTRQGRLAEAADGFAALGGGRRHGAGNGES